MMALCQNEKVKPERNAAATIGLLQGGGSFLGVDFEKLIYKGLGLQAGVGLLGFGAGINFHFEPSIRSSFISIQYWNQGIGDSFTQNAVGPCYVYRAKKWFTFQLGLARPLSRGPALPKSFNQPDVMLTYAIGLYLPL
jgi:hypothetical protein